MSITEKPTRSTLSSQFNIFLRERWKYKRTTNHVFQQRKTQNTENSQNIFVTSLSKGASKVYQSYTFHQSQYLVERIFKIETF